MPAQMQIAKAYWLSAINNLNFLTFARLKSSFYPFLRLYLIRSDFMDLSCLIGQRTRSNYTDAAILNAKSAKRNQIYGISCRIHSDRIRAHKSVEKL